MDVTSDAIAPIGFAQNGSKSGWYNVTGRAARGGVLFLVLYDALFVVVTGVLIRVATGWATSRGLTSKYANISHNTFSGMLCASLIVLPTTFLAGFFPALRASRIDPASALRGE